MVIICWASIYIIAFQKCISALLILLKINTLKYFHTDVSTQSDTKIQENFQNRTIHERELNRHASMPSGTQVMIKNGLNSYKSTL